MGPRKQKNRDIVVARSGSNSENTHTSDEDFPAGVGLSPESGSQDDFTSSSNASYDEEEHIPGEWDTVDDFAEHFEDEELTPSDSASRPSGSRKHRPIASETSRSHRKSRRAPVEEAPLPPRQSRSRKVRDPREYRRRTTSVESDSLDSHDDYPYPGGYGRAPPHPSAQWGHVPHATGPQGYASSSLVSTAYPQQNPFTGGGMPPPGNQLVPFSQQDGYGYPPHGHNPFFSPTGSGTSSSYFGEIPYDRRGMDDLHRDPYGRADVYGRPPPRDRSFDRPPNRHRHSVHGPPHMPSSGYEMMPYGGMYPGYPPHMPPYYPHHSSGHTPPSKKATPAPVPDIPVAVPTSSPIPVSTPGPSAEDDRIAKLEALLAAQLRMQEEKAETKKKAAEQAARLEAEAKKKGDEDKLAKLEKLILAQKAEQIAREKAADAKAEAARKDADAKAAKEAADKKAAEEEAARLVDAAKKAREEAEAEAQKKADDAKAEHEKAIAEAKKAADEAAAAAKKAEEEKKAAEAALKPAPEEPKAPIKFKDAVGRKFSFPWHICKTWKGMEDLIKQAFLHVDVIGLHVQEGHYDLVGPNGEIILPQVWETMIQPDWAVTMHMWPMPEPPLAPDPKGPPPPGPGGDPFIGLIPPITKKPSKGKAGKKVAPPPPPPPPIPGPPPPGMMMDMPPPGGGLPPDVMVVEPKKTRPPAKKVNSGLNWFAGGGGASKSLKGPKRPDGSSVTAGSGVAISRSHSHDQEAGCLMM